MAPSAEAPAADAWSRLAGRVRELRARVGTADPILADRVVGRTWAEAMLLSYGLVRDVSGTPLDYVPADALPHVRAAVAWRMAARSSDDDLATRVETVARMLARRETRALAEPLQSGHLRIAGLWARDLPGEEGIPWVAYLQDARRAWSPDATIDGKICVLEAAARMNPVQVDLLVEGLGDEQELVRWTAARLLAATKPGHIALAHARDDSSARVRQRAGQPQSPSSG
ncbi:MAG: hypothetical protein GXP62_10700 [Oligoflexia bacterium]|nr:hypothetical protein [Oligoflexia bacterium]